MSLLDEAIEMLDKPVCQSNACHAWYLGLHSKDMTSNAMLLYHGHQLPQFRVRMHGTGDRFTIDACTRVAAARRPDQRVLRHAVWTPAT